MPIVAQNTRAPECNMCAGGKGRGALLIESRPFVCPKQKITKGNDIAEVAILRGPRNPTVERQHAAAVSRH